LEGFRPIDLVNFDDVVASAEEFVPNVIKLVIGRMNVQNGLQTLLQHFQDPLLNKQVKQNCSFYFYNIFISYFM
jgi:hypothetical protein